MKNSQRGRRRSRIPIVYNPSPPTETEVEEAKDDFPTNENEWMDANDFFNMPAGNAGTRAAHLAFEEAPGCKRSSIIRIRTEKKGICFLINSTKKYFQNKDLKI